MLECRRDRRRHRPAIGRVGSSRLRQAFGAFAYADRHIVQWLKVGIGGLSLVQRGLHLLTEPAIMLGSLLLVYRSRAALLLAADQIADQFAVIGESTGPNLFGNPGVLLVGHGDGLADGCHCALLARNVG